MWCSTCGRDVEDDHIDRLDIYCEYCKMWWEENKLQSEDDINVNNTKK